MRFFIRAGAIIDRVNEILVWLAGILIAFALVAVCYEVSVRQFFRSSVIWALESTEHALFFITLLSTAWLLGRGRHVRIDFLTTRLSPRAQIVVNVITSILGALSCLAVAWFGIQTVLGQIEDKQYFSTSLMLPMAPIYSIIPISFLLLSIQFIRMTYKYISGWKFPGAERGGGAEETEISVTV